VSPTYPLLHLLPSSPTCWSRPEAAEKILSWQISSGQDSIACFVASQKGGYSKTIIYQLQLKQMVALLGYLEFRGHKICVKV